MKKFVLPILALLVSCKSAIPPSSFGVNLEISLASVQGRASIVKATVTVSGDEAYSKSLDVANAVASSEIRIHYVPGIRSGIIRFAVDVFDGGGALIANGVSGDVTIHDGSAVLEMIALQNVQGGSKQQGEACSTSGECGTAGGCVDGVCCDTACTESCQACNIPGVVGTCSIIADGSPPVHGSCTMDPVSTCGHDGSCDGNGSCRLYKQGTACSSASCDTATNILTPAAQCNGTGLCVTLQSYDCAPYRCQDSTACFGPPCSDSTQCAGTRSCTNGSCGLLPNGRSCTMAAQCMSGYCVDGVCCGSACMGQCEACDIPDGGGLLGTCQTVTSGAPHSSHQACTGAGTVCAGTCNGSSATQCSYPTSSCGASSCSGTTQSNQSCSMGACSTTNVSCLAGFGCSGAMCATTCDVSSDAGCATNYYCAASGAKCIKKIVFGSPISDPGSLGTNFLIVADFDNNGKPDVVLENGFSGGSISSWLGNGDGTFTSKSSLVLGMSPAASAVGDFNADGKLDIAVADQQASTMTVLMGNGDGTFAAKTPVTLPSASRGIAVADFDKNGKVDIAVSAGGAGSVSIYMGNGDGTFTLKATLPIGGNPGGIAVGDFNGDTVLDVAIANPSANNIAVWLGQGDGTFTSKSTPAAGTSPSAVATADFNKDGKLDLVAGNNQVSGTVTVLTGVGDGTFQFKSTLTAGLWDDSVAVGDFNQDGLPDFVSSNDTGSGAVDVFIGAGDATFSMKASPMVGSEPHAVAVSDVNGDGKPDIVTHTYGASSAGSIVVILNTSP